MTDEPGYPKALKVAGREILPFRKVSHTVYWANLVQSPLWVGTTSTGDQTYSCASEIIKRYDYAGADPVLTDGMLSFGVTADTSAIDTGHYARWDKVKPTMATRASLGVFLWELRDLKRMFELLPKKHVQGVSNWRELLTYVNSQHLNWNFGWKPFIKDVKHVFNGVSSFEDRLDRFVANQNRALRRRYRDLPVSGQKTLTTALAGGSAYTHNYKCDYTIARASCFDFLYNVPPYGTGELRWRAMLDTLGLNANPSTIWAVIPWSFVVDWFWNVGGFLKQYEDDWLNVWVNLIQASYSRDISGTVEWAVKSPSAGGGANLPGIRINFSQYTRSLGAPNFSGASDPFTADRIRLGASLLIGQFNPRRTSAN